MVEREPVTEVQIDCFLLCDFAQVAANKLTIVGGGSDRFFLPSLPGSHLFYLAFKATFGSRLVTSCAGRIPLQFDLLDPAGNPVGAGTMHAVVELPASGGRPTNAVLLPIALDVTFQQAGTYTLTCSIRGQEQARASVVVQSLAPRAPEDAASG